MAAQHLDDDDDFQRDVGDDGNNYNNGNNYNGNANNNGNPYSNNNNLYNNLYMDILIFNLNYYIMILVGSDEDDDNYTDDNTFYRRRRLVGRRVEELRTATGKNISTHPKIS